MKPLPPSPYQLWLANRSGWTATQTDAPRICTTCGSRRYRELSRDGVAFIICDTCEGFRGYKAPPTIEPKKRKAKR